MPINVINEHRSKLSKQYFFAKICSIVCILQRWMASCDAWFTLSNDLTAPAPERSTLCQIDSFNSLSFATMVPPLSLSLSRTSPFLNPSHSISSLSFSLTLSRFLSLSLSNGRRVSQTYSHAFSPSLSYTLQVIYSLNLSLLPKASLPPSPSLARTLVASCHDSHT